MKIEILDYETDDERIDIRIDDYDTYSAYATLALIIHAMLVKFKEERKKMPGVPIQFFEEGDELTENGNHTEAALAIAEQRYITFIDECIWAFYELSHEYQGDPHLIGDQKASTAYHERLEAATTAFGRYFQTLWW